MTTYKYDKGKNLCYNTEFYTVFRHRLVDNQPAYLIRKISDGTVLDNILESDCMDCDCSELINQLWNNFIYTGDNKEASKWVVDNILRNVCSLSSINYGPNSDSSIYTFNCDDGTWTRNKTA